MKASTKNFHPDTDLKLSCTCNHPKCDKRSVNQRTLDKAQIARDIAQRPLTVTSGGRCPNHIDEKHRTLPADHQKCQGIDIRCAGGFERGELVAAGLAAGFNAIGVGSNFVHWGDRVELPEGKIMIWHY